jgi:hypothetical protein
VQGEEFPTVERFMAKYRLDAPAALERKEAVLNYIFFSILYTAFSFIIDGNRMSWATLSKVGSKNGIN